MQQQLIDELERDNIYNLKHIDEDEIDRRIIAERNTSITQLHQDIEHIAEISKHMATLVAVQGEELDDANQHLDDVEETSSQAHEYLQEAETITENIRGLFKKGILLSSSVTGISAMGMILNPIIGGIGVIIGIGGIVACSVQMKKQQATPSLPTSQ